MNTFNLPRRGNTYRDDFNSWQPAWRTVIAAAISPLRPVLRRLRHEVAGALHELIENELARRAGLEL